MLSHKEKIYMTIITGEFLLGFLVNGFIALVNCINWVKSKKLSSSDLILISLAFSRIGLVCAIIWNSYSVVHSIDIFITDYLKIIHIFLIFSHNSNIWFATVLSIFYFLKITNFTNSFFLWIKSRIDRMIFILLWGPLIPSFSISFPIMERMHYHQNNAINRGKERNMSQEVQVSKSNFFMLQILLSLLSLIPFTISVISFSLLILSLWRHTRQMQLHATGSRDPSTEAHIRAMKAVVSFLIFILLYYLGFFYIYMISSQEKNNITFMIRSFTVVLINIWMVDSVLEEKVRLVLTQTQI
ncbi:taste receptor type 2 member 7-like [Antechinus flavipes]|uniref:taste receptor type 2 member 7-like n=1 Tax=Antechinus flavipes TaxID=38775 RepID=UPI00223617A4|nr:taste receptor type 2 member 7-like [Antechinus flavipes]